MEASDDLRLEGLGGAIETCKGVEVGIEDMARLSAEVEALAAVPIGDLMGEFSDAIKYGRNAKE